MTDVVIGATGGAGGAIAAHLAAAGRDVVGLNRNGNVALEGVVARAGDVSSPEGAAAAVAGADVVVMAAQPPYHRWSRQFPDMLNSVVEATARVGAKLVMVDNLYAYGPGSGVISESTPHRATDRKGRTRAGMVESLLEAHHRGRLRVAIGQASDYLGPGAVTSAVTSLAVTPVASGGDTIRWLGRLDVPHSAAYLPDIGRAYFHLVAESAAEGSAWVLPHAGAPTGAEFADLLARVAGRSVEARPLPTAMLRMAAPFHRLSRESLGIAYQWTQPWVADSTRFEEAFGWDTSTPLDEAVAGALDAEMGAARLRS